MFPALESAIYDSWGHCLGISLRLMESRCTFRFNREIDFNYVEHGLVDCDKISPLLECSRRTTRVENLQTTYFDDVWLVRVYGILITHTLKGWPIEISFHFSGPQCSFSFNVVLQSLFMRTKLNNM